MTSTLVYPRRFQTFVFDDKYALFDSLKDWMKIVPEARTVLSSAGVCAAYIQADSSDYANECLAASELLPTMSEVEDHALAVSDNVGYISFHPLFPGGKMGAAIFVSLEPKTITSIEHSAEGDISKLIFNDDPTDFFPKFPCFEYRGVKSSYHAFFTSRQSTEHALSMIRLVTSSNNLHINPSNDHFIP